MAGHDQVGSNEAAPGAEQPLQQPRCDREGRIGDHHEGAAGQPEVGSIGADDLHVLTGELRPADRSRGADAPRSRAPRAPVATSGAVIAPAPAPMSNTRSPRPRSARATKRRAQVSVSRWYPHRTGGSPDTAHHHASHEPRLVGRSTSRQRIFDATTLGRVMRIPFHASPCASLGIEVELSIVDRQTRELTNAASALFEELGAGHPDRGSPQGQARAVRVHGRDHHRRVQHGGRGPGRPRGDAGRGSGAAAAARSRPDLGRARTRSRIGARCASARTLATPSSSSASSGRRGVWPSTASTSTSACVRVRRRWPSPTRSRSTCRVFLALSASSPFWHGLDTGMASARTQDLRGLADRGPTPAARQLRRLRDLHGDVDRGERDRVRPRGVVGRAAAPGLRHGRAAHVRRDGQPDRGGRGWPRWPRPWCTRSTRSSSPGRRSAALATG